MTHSSIPMMQTTSAPQLPRRLVRLGILGLVLALPMVGCKKTPTASAATSEAAVPHDPNEVTVPPSLTGQIAIGQAKEADVLGALQVTARVAAVGPRIAHVGAPVAGRITSLRVREGDQVRRGASLATLHSTDLSDTQFTFVKAKSNEALAQQATRRAEQLVAADVIGRAELDRRQAEALQASEQVASIRAQLHSLGMGDNAIHQLENNRQLNADYPVISPIGGTVLERKVTLGQIVQPAEVDFTVADLSTVWIVANVPEEEAGRLKRGMEVEVRLPALPDKTLKGHLSFVAPIVDPATRTVEVHMDVPNGSGLYKPDMLASMTFLGKAERRLTVPQTALVRENNKDYVFVAESPTKFVLREVTLGAEVDGLPDDERDDRRVVDDGISPGDTVVLDGAFHLNNQRKADAIKGGD